MNDQFIIKVKYTKQLDNGTFKRVTEPYFFNAYTFTDAETRVYEELGGAIRGEFSVVSIARTEIHDIFRYEECDVWYKGIISFMSEAEEGGKGKKTKQNFLISAISVKEAYEKLKEQLSTLMVDYKIDSMAETPIVEIFPFREDLDREISRTMPEESDYTTTEEAVDELP